MSNLGELILSSKEVDKSVTKLHKKANKLTFDYINNCLSALQPWVSYVVFEEKQEYDDNNYYTSFEMTYFGLKTERSVVKVPFHAGYDSVIGALCDFDEDDVLSEIQNATDVRVYDLYEGELSEDNEEFIKEQFKKLLLPSEALDILNIINYHVDGEKIVSKLDGFNYADNGDFIVEI